MCQRHRHLMAAGKPKVVATTAIAREMVDFIWAIARAVTAAPGGEARA
jgi:transposase